MNSVPQRQVALRSGVGHCSGRRHGRTPKFVLSLIGRFCHKGTLPRPFSDRKRITKANYCKCDTYAQAQGEGGRCGGQELRCPRPNFPILHEWDGLRDVPGLVPGDSCQPSAISLRSSSES